MKNRRPLRISAFRDLLLVSTAWVSTVCASLQPFLPAETAGAIAKRQECIPNFYSCADQGDAFIGVCCQNGQRCALDADNNPACCPAGAVCTGTAPASFATPRPATTAASYVPNPYFSFPYVATYFANRDHCSAAISQCSSNYEACTAQLGGGQDGGGYAVTIVVPGGGGTTVAAAAGGAVGAASATSICSSLSSAACGRLQPDMCTLTDTSAAGFYFGTENAAARPTMAACAGVAGAVAAAGVAGLGIF
ncbi:hypothetical protein VTK26DRAFT_2381 [Humicola hyalothermophila]